MGRPAKEVLALDVNTVRETIVESGGLVSTMAKRLGVSLKSLDTWLDKHPALRVELEAVRADVAKQAVFDPPADELRDAILAYDGRIDRIGAHFGFSRSVVTAYFNRHTEFADLLQGARQLAVRDKLPVAFEPEPELLLDAIDGLRGNIAGMAMRFHVSRNVMLNYVNAHPEIQAAVYSAHEKTLDMVETTLENRALAGEAWAVCCVEGTLVTLADGTQRPIETIKVGDSVLSHCGKARVVSGWLVRPYNGTVIELEINRLARKLTVTPEHPIYSAHTNRAESIWWREACSLIVGDSVHITSLNAFATIVAVTRVPYAGLVYNLEVYEDNSYSAEEVSVHNCFYLKTQGRKRGYIERGESFNLNVNLDKLNIEQLERLAAGEHPSLVLGAAADSRGRAGSQTIDARTIESTSDFGAEEEAG